MKYGYARVSSADQNLERQLVALKKVGVDKIFQDKESGKDFDRKSYKQLRRKLKEGDEIYIKAIDRLGRNYDEILEEWRFLTRTKNADIIVLDFPLLDTRDTRNGVGGVTGKFIADIVLQILCYVSQIERENTKKRQAEGIRIAKEKGTKFGRPYKPLPEGFNEAKRLYLNNIISSWDASKMCNVPHTTFLRWVKNR